MRVLVVTAALALAGCGDDGALGPSSDWFARCQTPRAGASPATGDPYPDRPGTADDEKRWVRAWIDELYLWYDEVPDLDPGDFPDPIAYFQALRTPATTPSGRPKDRFHFTIPTAAFESESIEGVAAGYGAAFTILSAVPPRVLLVAFTEPGSPAAAANLVRGTRVESVDGVPVIDGTDVGALNAGLFPAAPDETHTLTVLDPGATEVRTVTMTTALIEIAPVKNVAVLPTATGPVGYLTFTDHIASAEEELVAAITQLAAGAVTDLVVDLRYNGGGYLAIASELAYMIAGPAPDPRIFFERTVWSDKYPAVDPITGEPLTPTPFFDHALGFSLIEGEPLPSLHLGRVFVLVGGDTCSASEAIVNGLRGIDVDVVLVGGVTCGKPYGFYPQDDCGTTYFAIEFQGENAKGFGDYTDGFPPDCLVADDFDHALGDPAEGRLAAALQVRETGTCPPPSFAPKPGPTMVKSFWRENRIGR